MPAPGRPVVSVRQNLTPLIDRGSTASTPDRLSGWGATLGGVIDPARSALGITAAGNLIWAGGEPVTAAQIADALLRAQVASAVELDINPRGSPATFTDTAAARGRSHPCRSWRASAESPESSSLPGTETSSRIDAR